MPVVSDPRELTPDEKEAGVEALVKAYGTDRCPLDMSAALAAWGAIEGARASSPAPDAEAMAALKTALRPFEGCWSWGVDVRSEDVVTLENAARAVAAVASSPVPEEPHHDEIEDEMERLAGGHLDWDRGGHEALHERAMASLAARSAAAPVSVGDEDYCGAQDWYRNEDGEVVIDGTCGMPVGHDGNKHHDFSKGEVWHEWHGPADRRAPEDEGGGERG